MNSQLFGQKQEPNAAPWTRIEILKNKDNVAVLRAARAGKTNSLQGSTSIFLPHHGGRSAQKAQISDGSSMSCSILIPTTLLKTHKDRGQIFGIPKEAKACIHETATLSQGS